MRKKLVVLVLALAATAAASVISPAAAATCPKNTRPIDCGTFVLCCPFNAFCFCGG